MSSAILRRKFNAVYLFDVIESGCNGDPNNDGRPRQDDLGHLWWTDVAIKRFFREWIIQRFGGQDGYQCLIQHGKVINDCQDEALEEGGIDVSELAHADDDGAEKTGKRKKKVLAEEVKHDARLRVAGHYYDARSCGLVLGTG
jgi:Cas7 group CRISPR-associated protein Csh2